MEAQTLPTLPSYHHRPAAGGSYRPRTPQPQCRARLLQRQAENQRNPMGGQRGDSRQGERLVSSCSRQGRKIRQCDTARLRHHRPRRQKLEGRTPCADAAQHPRTRTETLSGTLNHRPISSLLSNHSIAHQAHHPLVDERPANRTALAENRGDRRARPTMQR